MKFVGLKTDGRNVLIVHKRTKGGTVAKRRRAVAVRRGKIFGRARVSRKAKFTLPLAVVAGFVPVGMGLWANRGSVTGMANQLRSGFLGLNENGSFQWANLKGGLLPVGSGILVHMIAGKLGINRAIARAGIPFIRI